MIWLCKRAIVFIYENKMGQGEKVKTVYLFSSPEGDVPVSKDMMQRPFILRPLENHPFLTLGDFLHAIRDFVCQNEGKRLCGIIGRLKGQGISCERIDQLIIRYEKYGTLYQIASVEAAAENLREKLAVMAALTPDAKKTLDRECKLLDRLIDRWPYPFIPRIYVKDMVDVKKSDKVETFKMALSDWFDGYHEWHFSGDKNIAPTIDVWDMGQGLRSAATNVICEIIRQATMILTLYYDPASYGQIYPWHHGAGDFVVKVDEDRVDVRLISVRGYGPLIFLLGNKQPVPLEALMFFFLDMTVKMRLDKLEGMGEPLWAGDFVLPAILEGFIEGIRRKEKEGELSDGIMEKLIHHLKKTTPGALRARLFHQIEIYREIDPTDFICMKNHLNDHADALHRVLQNDNLSNRTGAH